MGKLLHVSQMLMSFTLLPSAVQGFCHLFLSPTFECHIYTQTLFDFMVLEFTEAHQGRASMENLEIRDFDHSLSVFFYVYFLKMIHFLKKYGASLEHGEIQGVWIWGYVFGGLF